jgi:hypothetical protein
MEASLSSYIDELLPLIRQFSHGEYGIALGGAHAKGLDDRESDVDLYLFTRDILSNGERSQQCQQFSACIEGVVSWGEMPAGANAFTQAGTDFLYKRRKVECWLRNSDHITATIVECQQGIVRQDLVTWTVMGFYNHCALSDLTHMIPLDDPYGLLAHWKAEVSQYPLKLQQAIISRHLTAARFWPDNFHYKSAIERLDIIYTTGIVQQVIHNLIQVVFAVNQTYFPGDKKLDLSLQHLALQPADFGARIKQLLSPGVSVSRVLLEQQRLELCRLLAEVEELTRIST